MVVASREAQAFVLCCLQVKNGKLPLLIGRDGEKDRLTTGQKFRPSMLLAFFWIERRYYLGLPSPSWNAKEPHAKGSEDDAPILVPKALNARRFFRNAQT